MTEIFLWMMIFFLVVLLIANFAIIAIQTRTIRKIRDNQSGFSNPLALETAQNVRNSSIFYAAANVLWIVLTTLWIAN